MSCARETCACLNSSARRIESRFASSPMCTNESGDARSCSALLQCPHFLFETPQPIALRPQKKRSGARDRYSVSPMRRDGPPQRFQSRYRSISAALINVRASSTRLGIFQIFEKTSKRLRLASERCSVGAGSSSAHSRAMASSAAKEHILLCARDAFLGKRSERF